MRASCSWAWTTSRRSSSVPRRRAPIRFCSGEGFRSWKGWTCGPCRPVTTISSCYRSRCAGTKERRHEPSHERRLLHRERKRNLDQPGHALAAVEHDRLVNQVRKRVADCARELVVAESLDNSGTGNDVTRGVDGEPRSDESRAGFQLELGGKARRRVAGHEVLERAVGDDRQAVGPDRGEIALAGARGRRG